MVQLAWGTITILNWSFNPTSLLVSDKSVIDFKFVLSSAAVVNQCISVKIDPIFNPTGRSTTQQFIINSYKPFVQSLTSCTVANQDITVNCDPITSTNDLMIKITGNTNSVTTIIGKVINFHNPFSQTTIFPRFSYSPNCDGVPDGGIANEVGDTSDSITFSYGTINDLTFSSSSTIVGSSGNDLIISFKPGTALPLEGEISITAPKRYVSPGGSEIADFLPGTSSLTVTPVSSQFSSFSVLSNNNRANPQRQEIKLKFQLSTPVSGAYFYDNTNTFSFKISGLNNPISGVPVSGFIMTTQDFDGQQIDENSGTYSLTGVNDFGIMNSASVVITDTVYGTNHIGIPTNSIKFTFRAAFPLELDCFIRVRFPSDVKIGVISSITSYQGSGVALKPSSRPADNFDSLISYDETAATANNEFTIQGCGDQTVLGGNREGIIIASKVVSPGQFMDTGDFIIEIYKDSAQKYRIASTTKLPGGAKILSSSMSNTFQITNMLIEPISDDQTGARTDVKISLSIGTNLYFDSKIEITLPAKVNGYSSACSITSWSSTVTNVPTCQFSGTNNNILTIQNMFLQPPLPNTWATNIDHSSYAPVSLWFQIFEVINPDSTRPGGGWSAKTYNKMPDSAYALVDAGSSTASYDCDVGQITAATSLVVSGDITTREATYYEFQVNIAHNIMYSTTFGSGMLRLIFPSEFRLSNRIGCYSSCPTEIASITRTDTSTVDIKITTGTSILASSNPWIIKIKGIQNPRSQKPTNEIKIVSYDSQSGTPLYKIDEGSGFSTTMSQRGIIDSVALSYSSSSKANKTNGAQTVLNIKLTQSSDPLIGGDLFYFTLPAELSINPIGNTFSCSPSTVLCTRSGNSIAAKVPSGTSSNTFEFQVNGAINPPNKRTTSKMSAMYVKDSDNYYVTEATTATTGVLTVTTDSPAWIQSSSLYQDSLSLGVAATYRIEFMTQGKIGKTGSIVVTWPPQVTITEKAKVLVTSNGKLEITPEWQVSNRKMIIKGAFVNVTDAFYGSIQIEISPVLNPRDNRVVGSFAVYTYDDATQLVDIDKLPEGFLIPQLDCNYPCKSCLGSDRNYCLSCWQDTDLSFLQNSGTASTCQSACASGFTTNGDKSKVCIKCDQTCKTCLDSSRTKCVTCADNSKYFYPESKTCQSSCEAGFFESQKFTCSPCKAPCQKCTGTATTCTDCFKDSKLPYLYDKNCLNTCPSGFAGVEQACLPCQSPCQTCFNSSSQCLSCNTKTSFKYLFAFTCLNNCPINTVADTQKFICKGCLTGCKRCEERNQTRCLECQTPFVLFNSQCLADCPGGYKRTQDKLGCEMSELQDLKLIYFPHAIAAILLIVLAIGGYFKDRKSIIISNIIVLLGPIELLAIIVQLGLSLMFSTVVVTGATGLAVLSYILINCVFVARFNKLVAQVDADYSIWLAHHQKTFKFITFVTRFFSFKMSRLYYSYLYGFDIFKVRFENPEAFRSLLRNYSLLHAIFSSLVIIGIDAVILLQDFGILKLPLPSQGVISLNGSKEERVLSTLSDISKKFKIDSQMKIVMIETLLLSAFMLLITLCEFIKIRRYMSPDYNMIQDDRYAFASLAEEKNDKQLRRDMLKKIMQQVKGSQDLFNEGLNVHKANDFVHAFGRRRCRSMNSFDNNREGDPRQVQSEPPTPKKEWDNDDNQLNRFTFQDNVYAESQPPNPLGKIGKTYVDADAQVSPDEFARVISRKGGDFLQFDALEKNPYTRTREKNKKRGRKNQYYTQIDAEDDQEVDNLNESAYLSAGGEKKLGVIREQDEPEEQKRKSKLKSPSSKRPNEQEERIKKEAEESTARNAAAAAKKLKEQQEAKRLEDEIASRDADLKRSPTFGKYCEDPKVQVPPDQNKRTFNENDILGDFDRDEKGNIIILQDQQGNSIDKLGRRVNERGYLIDPSSGDIIENQQKQSMFPKQDLDDTGEIPAPFCVEKYNFSPFKIRGEFNLDKNKNPIITKNRNGDKVDKYNRIVNSKGWLVDRKGNVVDLMGVKKFDVRQLNPDNEDLPRLLNYQGKRFDILDICGAFDLNPHNGEITLKKNAQGQHFDKFGRLVNQKGYLIDIHGNIVDKDGKKIFDKKQISANGEIPKIFPFTKFNINNILADFEMDPAGNPILQKKSDGHFQDRQGRRVSSRGYFIDESGNVIDKKGKIMFNKELLDSDGEIPEVFRSGLLKSDSASSLSRLMSEIERNQPEEVYRQPARKPVNANSGGDTSFDSGMDDTPSNYNHANRRVDTHHLRGSRIAQIDEEDASIISGIDADGQPRKRKKGMKRRKKVVQEYNEPSDKDRKMARAYGGVAKGAVKRQIPKGLQARGVNSPRSQMSQQKILSQVAGSVSGLKKNQAMRADMEESKIRLNQNQSIAVLNETNDPSIMAVPEHHLREERLKRQKLKEAKLRGQLKKKNGGLTGPGDPDFEKMFGKDIDEFLEDSDWDVESFDNMSQYSRGTAKSAFFDGRIRGLESIYLQRIESGMKKGMKHKGKASKPKFRVLQDRFVDDPSYMHEGAADGGYNEESSQVSQKRKVMNSQSAMGQYGMRNMSVTAQTQFLPGSQKQLQNQL